MNDTTTQAAEAAPAEAPAEAPAQPATGAKDGADWETFRATLPEDTRKWLTERGHDKHGFAEIVGAYQAAQRLTGVDPANRDIIQRPKAPRDKAPDAWAAYDKAMGKPEAADKYETFKPSTGELSLPEAFIAEFDKHIFEMGGEAASPAARAASLEFLNAYLGKMQAEQDAASSAVQKEFGDQLPALTQAGMQAVETFGGKEFLAWVKENGFETLAPVQRLLVGMAKATANDGPPPSGAARATGAGTREQTMNELNKLEQRLMRREPGEDRAAMMTRREELTKTAMENGWL